VVEDDTELAGESKKIIEHARGLHARDVLKRAIARRGGHRDLTLQNSRTEPTAGVVGQVQDGIARELRELRSLGGCETTRKRSERNAGPSRPPGRGQLQIRVRVV